MGNPVWQGEIRLGKDACRCLLLLGTLVSQEDGCRMLLLVGSCWWGILVGQEKLGWGKTLVVCCLLLLGTLVSQKNCRRMLLLVGSCRWGVLVSQERLGWGVLLVGGDAEWPDRKRGLGRPKLGWGASTAWLGGAVRKPRGLTSEDGLGRPKHCWGSSTPWLGVASINHGVQPLRVG